jgi:hypothetical protein
MSVTTGRPRTLRAPDPNEAWDRDAEGNTEQRVVNVSPYTARFEIAGTPGSPPRKYKLEPGQTTLLPGGYTREFMGAGRQPVRATIESLTEREVFAKGPRLPMVVHEDRQADTHAQWLAVIDSARNPAEPVKVSIPTADGGEPIEALVRPPSIAPSAAKLETIAANMPQMDDEDQSGGELDEPPPDHNDPLPVVTAPAKGKGR